MAESAKAEIVGFEKDPYPHHVVDVEYGGVKRRVEVVVDDTAWTGLGWFSGGAQQSVETIVLQYVERRAAQGTLKDKEGIGNDLAADIHWGRW